MARDADRDRSARCLRLGGQRLLSEYAATSVAAACSAVVGLQAQSWPAACLGVRARTDGRTQADVERARLDERSVVWSWLMRGTLHLVATEDLGWLLGLLGPYAIAADRKRSADLGIDEAMYARGVRVLEAFLADGPRTRAEIDEEFERRALPIERGTQASIHLIQRAACEGRVCYGPGKSLVLLRDWADVGPALDFDVALAELARRYLAAFAPARLQDFAKWSGLPMPACRRAFAAIGKRMVEVDAWGTPQLMLRADRDRLADRGSSSSVRLLGAFDTYLIGYKERSQLVDDPLRYPRIWFGGLVAPVAIADGRVVATWKGERGARDLVVRVAPFDAPDRFLHDALTAEAADVGRFLDLKGRLVIED